MTITARRTSNVLTRAVAVVTLATSTVVMSGCGLTGPSPRAVTQEFVAAMQNQDWETACQTLSHDFIHRNMNGDSRYCVHYLEQWHAGSNTFEGMSVPSQDTETRADGTEVTVDLADGTTDHARVVDEGGELKLARYPGQDKAAR